MKYCKKCGQLKRKTEYHADNSKRDKLRTICKTCDHKRYIPKIGREGSNKKIEFEIGENGCWNCTSHYVKPKTGYPLIVHNRKRITMSRYMYLIHKGEIPEGMEIRHKCDNRKCINPAHLTIGTHTDNMQDMLKRNRRRNLRGSENPNAKLTESIVIEIKNSCLSGEKSKKNCEEIKY